MIKGIKPIILNFFILILLPLFSFSQEIEVVGQVTDEVFGNVLAGASITIIGTNKGTETNLDGVYSLTVNDPNAKLLIEYLGYKNKIVSVADREVNTLNIKLTPQESALDEVVVVGYGEVEKGDLTGAISGVKSEEFEKGEPLSIQDALRGRIAGVQISQNDNTPGAGQRVLIRGGTTLTGGNQPLYVIDNFPIVPDDSDPSQNPLADLNPNDIESIEVLKDASATAIYGAQGANGVIIITTKGGKANKPKIDVEYNTGVSIIDNVPDILTAEEYLDFQIRRGPELSFLNSGNILQVQQWLDIRESGQKGSVWINRITRPAEVQQANISFSGGTEDMNYRVSGGLLNQEGVVKNSDFNRINLSAKLDQKIGEKIKIGTSITYSMKESQGLLTIWDQNSLLKTVFQLNPFMADDFDISTLPADDPTFVFNAENVLTYIDEVQNFNKTERFLFNAYISYDIAPGINLWTSYGQNSFKNASEQFYPSSVRRGFDDNGIARFRSRVNTNTNFLSRLNINKRIKAHKFNGVIGVEARSQEVDLETFGARDFEEQTLGLFDLSSAVIADFPVNVVESNNDLSFLGRLVYNFKGKYLLTTSFRADASSRFGENNEWGYFPSLALGWVASKENFIENLNIFDVLKFRTSYGVTGNNQIPNFQSLASLKTQRYIFGDELFVGQVPNTVANPDLKWETTAQYDVGVDMSFLDERISITADAYYKETTDLLLEIQLPPTSGFDTAIENVGSISNTGFELGISTINVENDNFSWTSNFNISTNRTEVLDLGNRDEMFFSRVFNFNFRDEIMLRVGEEVGTFVGYIEDGIYNSQNEIDNSPVNNLLESVPGQVKFRDVNGDGVIDQNDRVIIGNTQPDFIGGLGNDFKYKNFDLSFFLRWSVGNDVVNGNGLFLDRVGQGNWNTLGDYANNAFSPLNPNATFHGQVPNTYSNYMRSESIEDGSFLKIDYITLGYTMPQKVIERINVKKFRVFARVNNPFLFTRYSWFDPEVSTGFGTAAKVGPGVDFATYPRAITYSVGATISL